jgi:hypothetical protein
MRRRELLLFLGGALTAARVLRAQQKATPVVGFLGSAAPGPYAAYVAAFRQGLSETGYVEGQNVTIEYRWAENHYDRLPALAADLVSRKVDLIGHKRGQSRLSCCLAPRSRGGRPLGSGVTRRRSVSASWRSKLRRRAPTRHWSPRAAGPRNPARAPFGTSPDRPSGALLRRAREHGKADGRSPEHLRHRAHAPGSSTIGNRLGAPPCAPAPG